MVGGLVGWLPCCVKYGVGEELDGGTNKLFCLDLLWLAAERRRGIVAWLEMDMVNDPIGKPASKRFCPTNPEVPELEEYREGPGWEWFTKYFKMDNKEFEWPFPVRTDILESRAEKAGLSNMREVRETCWEWKHGVDIGINTKEGVKPYEHTENDNNDSVYGEYGCQVMDALVTWNKRNVVNGPYARDEIPENVTIIKLTCREKGPGKCR